MMGGCAGHEKSNYQIAVGEPYRTAEVTPKQFTHYRLVPASTGCGRLLTLEQVQFPRNE